MRLLTGVWPVRTSWALLPLLIGPALGDALSHHDLAVARTASVLAWGAWVGVLMAVLLPRTASLTALRTVAPLAMVAANWAALTDDAGLGDAVALVGASLALVAAFAPSTGDVFVNGSAYGDERRMPLRVPGPVLFGPLPLAWVAAVIGPTAGPLLLAAQQWAVGAVVVVLGAALSWLALRSLHGLARRWVVLVPAGLVLHDHQALMEPVLFPRRSVIRLGPAPVDDEAFDTTQGAFGLALELELAEPFDISPRRADRSVRVESVDRILFTPTRPGVVLREAAARRIAVG